MVYALNAIDSENPKSNKVWVWHSEISETSCKECAELDGKVFYKENEIPECPVHPNCKCWVEEIDKNNNKSTKYQPKGNVMKGNPKNKEDQMVLKIRKSDKMGSGNFGSSRDGGIRKHNGIDIVNEPNFPVYALHDGIYTRQNQPYKKDFSYTGLDIKDINGNTNRYFYVTPTISIGANVQKGDIIGYSQNISAKYSPDMTNHYHFEVRDNNNKVINPNVYLFDYKFK